ncbi:MAG: hypothetical protein KKH41_09110, partial [Candidatus Thermoplasmatota archaeon]|nr:hypothetical protein [Euryarchaeota archaeon]MBU4032560.1 hypothetical protein [Candidatus Thermoplasmatota archaeon]MBU4070717.1 hypothetical protein [Candidatus Thermoplasmatota archaeon]MBU4144661.1 hypothetical protein [Candidatus Thermoplasmatota archaeon]MBU4592724.1 hypothetical protein [Candidatus Thermoplasmatota archaeon]
MTELIGRETELTTLKQALNSAIAGKGSTPLIEHVLAHIPRLLSLRIRALSSCSSARTCSIKVLPIYSEISAIWNKS